VGTFDTANLVFVALKSFIRFLLQFSANFIFESLPCEAIIGRPIKKLVALNKTQRFSMCSQHPAAGPYLESIKSNLQTPIPFLQDNAFQPVVRRESSGGRELIWELSFFVIKFERR
jgi:hypothetical protein